MSLVKKLQTGGAVDPNSLNTELDNQISQFQLKSKDERKVRDALGKFRDYMATGADKSLTVDPVTQQYKISGQGSEAFQGSPDEIERNWFSGNLKIKDDQDAMSVAAAIYNRALGSVKNKAGATETVATSTEKDKATLGNINDYITNSIYGTADNFKANVKDLTSPEQRKGKYLGWVNQRLDEYISNAEKNKEAFDYTDLQTAQNLKNLIAEGNWDKIKTEMYKLKWEPDKFITPEVDEAAEAAKKEKEQTNIYSQAGITNPESQKAYTKLGFTQLAKDWTPENIGTDASWFKEELAKANASILYNPNTGKHIIATPNGEFKYAGTDPFSKGYGYTITSDAEGLHVNTPEYNRTSGLLGADPNASSEGNVGRQVITDLPGDVYGWSNEQNGKYNTDIVGRRDYTQQLIQEINGAKKTWAKDLETGLYKDELGNEKSINVQGFGTNVRRITRYDDILTQSDNPLSTIKANSQYTDTNSFISELNNELQSINVNAEHDEDKLNKLASHARYLIVNGTPEEKQIALEQYLKLSKLFKQNNIPVTNRFKRESGYFKLGGLIKKGKKGMTADEYRTKYASPTSESEFKKSISKTGMIKNSSAADWVSLGGTALSVIPGLGVVGGLITTGADIVKDIQKDGFQKEDILNWNTAANLGFTALSGVGLGGLKALQVGAKALKVAKTAEEAGKIAGKLSKAKALVKTPGFQKATKYGSNLTKGLLVASAIPAATSAYESYSTAPDTMSTWDKLGRIKESDIQSGLMSGATIAKMGTAQKYKNILNRQTELVKGTKDVRKITVNGKDYEVAEKLNIPTKWKGNFKDKNKVDKLRTELETKLVGDTETKKKAISEILKSEDATKQIMPTDIKQNFVAGNIGERRLKKLTTDMSEKDLDENKFAKKLLTKNITNPGSLKRLIGKETHKARYAPKAKSEATKERIKKDWEVRNLKLKPKVEVDKTKTKVDKETDVKLNKQGGVLKFEIGGFAPLSGTGFGVAPKLKQAGKDIAKNINFDATDMANALMYANTIGTNTKVGNIQRGAIASGITSLPTLGRTYFRETSPYAGLGETEAGKVTSKIGRIAASTSDLDRSIGAQLEGTRQAADIRAKYNLADQERRDKIRGQQAESDARTNTYNLGVIGKNKLMAAEAAQKIGLVSANQQLAQNTAFSNFVTSYAKNLPIKSYKQTLGELNVASKDPKLKALSDEYTKMLSPEYEAQLKSDYEAKAALSPNEVKTPWETSVAKKNLDALRKQKYDQIMSAKKPYEDLSNELSYKRATLFVKSGGSLTKADRIELQDRKDSQRRREKDIELTYKMIMHNNEMLYKSLIKVFK